MAEPPPAPDRYAAPGSSHYYAIRFAETGVRRSLATVNATAGALAEIPVECSEPAVARHKLQWWREELERALQGVANHPVATALGATLNDRRLSAQPLWTTLPAIARQIDGQPLPDRSALAAHCRELGTARAVLFTQLCGGDPDAVTTALALGGFVELTGLVRNLGRDLRRQRCLLPLDPAALAACIDQPGPPPDAVREALAALCRAARDDYQRLLSTGPARARGLGPMLRLAAMADALLAEIDREGYRVIAQRTSLTPLHKLWIGWRRRG